VSKKRDDNESTPDEAASAASAANDDTAADASDATDATETTDSAAKSLVENIEDVDEPSTDDDEYDESIEAAVEAIAYHPVFEVIEETDSANEATAGGKGKKSKKKVSAGAALRTFFLSRGFSRGLGVVGESLITLGVVVMLFLGWQLWINDVIISNESTAVAEENVAKWTKSTTPAPTSAEEGPVDYGPAPVMGKAENAEVFGNIYIPRFGNDYIKVAAEGVGPEDVLNRGYFGRYPNSQLPGESGNLAFAVHRAGHGSPFRQAAKLQLGDAIVLQTSSGYYEYRVRNTEYVMPTEVEVVNAVPGGSNAAVAGQSVMTITTCNPELGNNERLIVYAVLVGWQPADAGPPKEIASMVKA
jgi:sortase A